MSQLERVSTALNRGIPERLWMSESGGIDSIFGGRSMPKPYSLELRERVVDAVETGASRREAAERFEGSASSAVNSLPGRRPPVEAPPPAPTPPSKQPLSRMKSLQKNQPTFF